MANLKTVVDVGSFDKMGINDIESVVFRGKEGEVDSQRSYMQALSYLETSKRFRENPTYSKVAFKDYLAHRFNMKFVDYSTMKTIYIQYPEEAAKHGVGFIVEVQKLVGKKKLPEALQAIADTQKERKRTLPLDKKREIVSKMAPESEQARVNWKAMYEEAKHTIEQLTHEVEERRQAMQEMDFRIQALKEENRDLKAKGSPKRTTGVKRYQRESRVQ